MSDGRKVRRMFDGPVADAEIPRLVRQHESIRDLMLDGNWRTLRGIARETDYPEASISAQLRHLRKARFGAWVIEKRRVTEQGLWEYRLCAPQPRDAEQLPLIEALCEHVHA